VSRSQRRFRRASKRWTYSHLLVGAPVCCWWGRLAQGLSRCLRMPFLGRETQVGSLVGLCLRACLLGFWQTSPACMPCGLQWVASAGKVHTVVLSIHPSTHMVAVGLGMLHVFCTGTSIRGCFHVQLVKCIIMVAWHACHHHTSYAPMRTPCCQAEVLIAYGHDVTTTCYGSI
jgi:hypothetical protein